MYEGDAPPFKRQRLPRATAPSLGQYADSDDEEDLGEARSDDDAMDDLSSACSDDDVLDDDSIIDLTEPSA